METISIFDATAEKRKVKQEQKAWKYIWELCSVNDSDLNKLAVIDGNRKFTYGHMFREWERYASVFTALDMTGESSARVGVMGSTCAEVIFSFYGLNMVGAQVSLVASWASFNVDRIKQTILDEKLTDFILTDDLAQPDLVGELLRKRRELGLRHVIILHVHMVGATSYPVIMAGQEAKSALMKTLYGPICMETLLASFGIGSRSVRNSSGEPDETAFILHTTGTTSGTGKPVPLSDGAFNAAVGRFMEMKDLSLPFDNLISSTMVDFSNSYGIIDQVHLPFAMGATVVTIPFGLLNPLFYRAISTYRVSFFFSVNSMFERWIKLPENTPFDFSSLKFVALGGTAVSAAEKKRYHEFLEKHGGKDVVILNGYGLSELGGACALSSPDLEDESIGYPMPGISIRLYDEENERYFSPRGKGGEGVLCITADSIATPKLDGREVVKVEIINRKPYVCTNDLVHVDPDGRITYLGRANRFFLRGDEGRKYESGKVETEFSRLKDIEGCAIVPVFHKMHHDTFPMLCVETRDEAGAPKDVIRKALCQVFIEEKTLSEDDIPSRVMLAEKLPRNINGKIDLYKINRGEVDGDIYIVEPVLAKDKLSDFSLIPYENDPGDVVEQIMGEITDDFKNKRPDKKLVKNIKEGMPPTAYINPFEHLDSMFYMHQQMRNNMLGMLSQWFPWNNGFKLFDQIPFKGRESEE